ncbi:TRADD-N-associated membrane domain-containing protein [Micromonospora sp. WMMD735]|uniref:TRADD-N-associated membrane domain-containing protein n=1 Tax=Micromonospora sp. WMMD735 TaxID=3404130 RepID=UPI003B958EA1
MAVDNSGESETPPEVYAVGRGVQQNVFYGTVNVGSGSYQLNSTRRLASERQKLYFGFFRQALQQAETTFRLSVIFMSCGAAIILASAILALINAGNPNVDYLPLVTSLTGLLITVGGGALAIHSNRARRHLAEQAERLDVKIEQDHKLEQASVFIERVDDARLKDRLRAMTAMQALGISPDPDLTANQILPEQGESAKEIGRKHPGNSA